MTSLVPQCLLDPHLKHARAKPSTYGNALGYGFRRNKKAMAVGLSSVSVLAADSPLFFWMHRHWRAMIQISAPTSGSPFFLSCYSSASFAFSVGWFRSIETITLYNYSCEYHLLLFSSRNGILKLYLVSVNLRYLNECNLYKNVLLCVDYANGSVALDTFIYLTKFTILSLRLPHQSSLLNFP